jgi:GNAT superfamily N-acetyltransferase
MDVMVREAFLTDAPGIATIIREVHWFENVEEESESGTRQRVFKRLQMCQQDKSHSVYVAEGDNGRIMGYAAVHWLPYMYLPGPEGYISELFIREEDRGHGIGTLLLDTLKTEAKERGCWRLMLINMRTRESYHREFYRKLGWVERDGAANFVYYLQHKQP